jgi:hypothetical protein
MRVSRVDPFGERQRRTWRRRYLVLGARVDFECETAALAAVVDAAYARPAGHARPARHAGVPRVFALHSGRHEQLSPCAAQAKVFIRRRAHQRDVRRGQLLGGGARPPQRAGRGVTRNAGATL